MPTPTPTTPEVVTDFDTHISKMNSNGRTLYLKLSNPMVKYYNEAILKNSSAIKALSYYKGFGYKELNNFLNFNTSAMVVFPSNPDSDPQSVISKHTKDMKAAYSKIIKMVKSIDKIIAQAPKIVREPVHVYRGMNFDIIDDIVCENGKMLYTFTGFISTSFSPKISKRFAGSGCLYTLILDKGCQGIYLNFSATSKVKRFQELYVDDEAEFLLPRGSKFEVLSVDFVNAPPEFFKFKDIPCLEKQLKYMKHYTLKFVGHSSEEEQSLMLKKALNIAVSNITYSPI